uniref:Uncharacterized protein n=1 Tax=Tanacetum cinerariifolium TaxID=118510 RepID=A0A699GJH8_TANCI|nr:hypothetical protein [Tanacetum cinerariifolium]
MMMEMNLKKKLLLMMMIVMIMMSDDERTNYDSDVIPDPNKTYEEHDDEKEEEYDDEFTLKEDENIDEEEGDEVTKELYKDVNVNLGNKDADMTYADQGSTQQQHASHQLGFEQEDFTTPIPPPPLFLNPLSQQATPTPTPMASETITSLPALLDLASAFKFNERVTNLEKDLSEMKQVDQYAQALSSILAIVDHYMDNKHGKAINKAIQAHNFDCKEEAQAEKREYMELVDSTMRTIIKEEVNAQLPQILPQAISDVATPSSYEAAATLFEFKLIKFLIDNMEKNKSFDVVDYKREFYDALVKSYNTNKDIFESYGKVFLLKRSQDDKDKDPDPYARLDRRTKRRNQVKMLTHPEIQEELSHNVENSSKQQDQEFVTRDNDEQPIDKEVTKADLFKKLEQSLTLDPDWNLEYLNGGDLSRKYSTFVTKTKAATYELKWIEDLVLEFWSPVQLKYDQHAYLGTSHWVSNAKASTDLQLYTFKEGDFKRLCLEDIEDILLLLVQQRPTNLTINEWNKNGIPANEEME